jgi:hypothetical protein
VLFSIDQEQQANAQQTVQPGMEQGVLASSEVGAGAETPPDPMENTPHNAGAKALPDSYLFFAVFVIGLLVVFFKVQTRKRRV